MASASYRGASLRDRGLDKSRRAAVLPIGGHEKTASVGGRFYCTFCYSGQRSRRPLASRCVSARLFDPPSPSIPFTALAEYSRPAGVMKPRSISPAAILRRERPSFDVYKAEIAASRVEPGLFDELAA